MNFVSHAFYFHVYHRILRLISYKEHLTLKLSEKQEIFITTICTRELNIHIRSKNGKRKDQAIYLRYIKLLTDYDKLFTYVWQPGQCFLVLSLSRDI